MKTNSVYWLKQRHGNTFRFDTLGRLATIVDPYNQSMTLTYTNNNWVDQVTDWKSRTLRFGYGGTPLRLTSVSDGSRSVAYAYTTNSDLIAVTDPESKTSSYLYDTNHQITATVDANNFVVTSNIYDAFGRVTTQYSQGDPNKAWQIYWSGWQTVEQDPAGDRRTFYYDDQSRLTATKDALGNLGQMFYDGQDHVVLSISPRNETNQAFYDGRHNLVLSIDPLGHSNQFYFDTQDRLMSSTDANGHTSRFGYNAQFSLIGITNGAGDWVTNLYDPTSGTLCARADAGGTATFSYDGKGQLSAIAYPGGLGSESFVNNDFGDVTSHTDARGTVTTFQYNARRQLTKAIVNGTLTSTISYDAAGNVQSATDPRGNATTSYWSPTGKPLGTAYPATAQGTPATTNLYDRRDWLSASRDPLLSASYFTNDAAGRLIATTDPLLRLTRFGYDANGRRTAITNAAQERALQQFDVRGQVTVATDNANNTVQRAYDPAGNQIFLTNRNSKRWQFQYDGANRLTNTITPASKSTKVALDARGLPLTVQQPSGHTATNSYDARGRLISRSDSLGTLTYQLDPNGHCTNLFEGIRTNAWVFDVYGRPTSYRDPDGNLLQYNYDANGNLTQLTYPGNKAVSYAYDALNRLTTVTDWASRQTTLEYDLNSRLTKVTRPNGTVREINYDPAGQTSNIVERAANLSPIAFFRLHWTTAGRVDWEFAAPLPHSNAPPTRNMTYDDDNRIATFASTNVTHDDDGNMTYGPSTNGVFQTYVYDARNRLLSMGGWTNGYDALDNRTSLANSTNITRCVINPNAALSQVLVRTNNGTTTFYVYGLGLLYEVKMNTNGVETAINYYHYDYRGSTVAMTDSGANVRARFEYSVYGTLTYQTNAPGTSAPDTPFLFNGRYGVQTDPNGLLYMRARYYNPYLCRFINADPSGLAGGLNVYAYAGGNPVSALDPFGLCQYMETTPSWLQQSLGPGSGGPAIMSSPPERNPLTMDAVMGDSPFLNSPGAGNIAAGRSFDIWSATVLPATAQFVRQAFTVAVAETSIVGQSFGKLGTVVENPGQTISGFTSHGFEAADVRGLTWDLMRNTVRTPTAVLQQSAGQYLYLTEKAGVVLNPAGQIMTTYPASTFGPGVKAVLQAASGGH